MSKVNPVFQKEFGAYAHLDAYAQFEAFVQKMMDLYDGAGVAISIIDKNQTLYEQYFGFRDLEQKLPVDRNTIFGLASLTKSFTCLAIMQMAQNQQIDINAPVTSYIPEYKNVGQDVVTIRHLMTHSAGYFPLKRICVQEIAEKLGIFETEAVDLAYSDTLAQEGIKLVAERLDAQQTKIGKPGEHMSYSNDCYGLLADIIRRHGGCGSFAAYLDKNILAPLGMDRSYCDFIKPAKDDNHATLYIHRGDLRTAGHDYYDNAFVLMGGGAMKSTICDLEKYLRMYMKQGVGADGTKLLAQYGINEMAKPQQIYRHQRTYGYGLSQKYIEDFTVIEHGGSLTGVSTNLAWSPELGIGVLVLCNTSNLPVSLISDKAMRWFAGKDLSDTSLYTDTSWSKETCQRATGRYLSGEGADIVIGLDGDSLTILVSGIKMEYRMVHHNMLLIKDKMSNIELTLMQDVEGTVWGIRFGVRIVPKVQ